MYNNILLYSFFLISFFFLKLSAGFRVHSPSFSILKKKFDFVFPKTVVASLTNENDLILLDASITKKIISTITAFLFIFQSPITAFAAVGEGDLPPGSLAFSKVLKYQDEWKKVYNTIETRQLELGDNEIQSIKLFLKQLANEYGDGIPDKSVSDQARSIAKEFRKEIRQCDDAASDKNFAKIIEIYPKSAKLLNDFLLLLQDVPDEL